MEQIFPALEGRLRQFRREAARLAAQQPRLAGRLGPSEAPPDVHVDRLLQGVALLHARTVLALDRARRQQDEHQLERLFPEQLRPFPECRIGPPAADALAGNPAVTGARYCAGPEAAVELDLDLGLAGGGAAAPGGTLDIYIDGDAAFGAVLRSALLGADGGGRCVLAVPAAAADSNARILPGWPFAPAGLDPEEALLPRRPGSHAGLALLREFFVFPARFNLVRLDLTRLNGTRRWTLRLPAPASSTPAAPLLQGLHAGHLRAGWKVSAGLRRSAAAPIAPDGRQSEYLLSVPPELEIFSIDRVLVHQPGGALELAGITQGGGRQGWVARRVANAPPGHEWRIAFRGECAWRAGATVSIDLTCCRRGAVLGRAARGASCRWQLHSLLALEQLPRDAEGLRELMASQAIGDAPAARAIINAVQALDVRLVLLRRGGAAPLMGSELRLQVDEAAFAGCGLLLFAQVMDRFFGECAHVNTFSRLVLVSARSGKELIRCKARNAGTLLE